MVSRWFRYKDEVVKLRKQGTSIGVINKKYGIPKSTLSGWFRKIKLNKLQKERIYKAASIKMDNACKKAVLWHNKQKEMRLAHAKEDAYLTLNNLDINDKNILELALSFLYLGEGAKSNVTSMGNSNPKILKFLINSVDKLYGIKPKDIKCDIHIRSDQNGEELNKYWSDTLNIPIENFGKFSIDKRTAKSNTYEHYKGVCILRMGTLHIQRKLLFLSDAFCDKISS